MAQVFLSYAHEDQDAALMLVRELERAGLSVWWDHTIPPGKSWDEVISAAIEAAAAAVVIWSPNSTASDWVKEEAQIALAGRKYLPVILGETVPPMGFRRIQGCNLGGWTGDSNDPNYQALLRELKARVAGAPSQATAPPSPPQQADFGAPASSSAPSYGTPPPGAQTPPRAAYAPPPPEPSAYAGSGERRWVAPLLVGIAALAALCVVALLWREGSEASARRVEADRAAWAQIDRSDPRAVESFRNQARTSEYRDLAGETLEDLRAAPGGEYAAAPPSPGKDAPSGAASADDPLDGEWAFRSADFPCGGETCRLEGVMMIGDDGAGGYACSFVAFQIYPDRRVSAQERCAMEARDGLLQVSSTVVSSDTGNWAADHFTLTYDGPGQMSGITHDGSNTSQGVPVRFVQ